MRFRIAASRRRFCRESLPPENAHVGSNVLSVVLLATYGYEVRTAYDAATAVREAAAFAPQVALLDLSRPEPDGLALASRFKQMPETKNTLLIALSGYGQPDDIDRSKEAGFVHHLVKPADPEVLHKLIQSKLEKD